VRLDLKIVEIHPAENDPCIRRCRKEAEAAPDGGVKPDALDLSGLLNRQLM
jgi:hypothetical protein